MLCQIQINKQTIYWYHYLGALGQHNTSKQKNTTILIPILENHLSQLGYVHLHIHMQRKLIKPIKLSKAQANNFCKTESGQISAFSQTLFLQPFDVFVRRKILSHINTKKTIFNSRIRLKLYIQQSNPFKNSVDIQIHLVHLSKHFNICTLDFHLKVLQDKFTMRKNISEQDCLSNLHAILTQQKNFRHYFHTFINIPFKRFQVNYLQKLNQQLYQKKTYKQGHLQIKLKSSIINL
eukprot:TRINITY_DN1493_c0_g2_i2.p4 TRINITY_DN1493_c0_g2~~TRINITY_DN1493_c0_g2_i2.p4  ORF type:complete len:236 (-),score=-11.87 TRINITY_DN1493_c0_g2_i2:897-1604(-)